MRRASAAGDAAIGVTIEATYTVGEYDIVIFSAEQSGGLETWLLGNGYRIPAGAQEVLGSYIKQGMRFFVARSTWRSGRRLATPTCDRSRSRSSPRSSCCQFASAR